MTNQPVDVEGELSSLAAETMALQLILTSLINAISKSVPDGARIAKLAFDEADLMAEAMVIRIGKQGRPDHTGKILPIIDQLRKSIFPS